MSANYREPQFLLPNCKNLKLPGTGTSIGSGLTEDRHSLYSMDFNGVNQYVDLDSGVSMVLLPTNAPRPTSGSNVTLAISPKSYSCWFKVNTTGTKTIFSSAPTGGGYHVKLDINSSNLLEFGLRTPSPAYTITTGTTTIAINTWYHVLVIVDGTNNKLYVNGALEGTTACSGNMIYYRHASASNPKNLIGGYWISSSGQDFIGKIDEFAIFSRALSTSEINNLWNGGSPSNPMLLSGKPVAYYPLGEQARKPGTANWRFPNEVLQGRAINFDGTDEINLSTVQSLTGEFSISIWIKPNAFNFSQVILGNDASDWIRLNSANEITFIFVCLIELKFI